MSDTVVTRIRLPADIHRNVKAEAARHGVNLDQALGMCVAFLCGLTTPLLWRGGGQMVWEDLYGWVQANKPK